MKNDLKLISKPQMSMLASCFCMLTNQESKSQMERLENERKVIQESLQQSADQVTSQLAEATAQNTELLNKREVCL